MKSSSVLAVGINVRGGPSPLVFSSEDIALRADSAGLHIVIHPRGANVDRGEAGNGKGGRRVREGPPPPPPSHPRRWVQARQKEMQREK